jgi:hypothetical protein
MYFVASVVFWENLLSAAGVVIDYLLLEPNCLEKFFANSVCDFCQCHVAPSITHLREQMNVTKPLMLAR